MLGIDLLVAGTALIAGKQAYERNHRRRQAERFLRPVPPSSAPALPTFYNRLRATYRHFSTPPWYSVANRPDGPSSGQLASPQDLYTEDRLNRDLAFSAASSALACAGAIGFLPLSLISLSGMMYGAMQLFHRVYLDYARERKMKSELIIAIGMTAFITTGQFILGNLAMLSYFAYQKLLQQVVGKAEQHLYDVFRLQPRTVWLLADGAEIETPYDDLQPHDVVVVYAGETIPVDGVITTGSAWVDQHLLTGEAKPVDVSCGDEVFASTVVLAGRIGVAVDKTGAATMASKIGEVLHQTAYFQDDKVLRAERVADDLVLPFLGLSVLSIPWIGLLGAVAASQAHPKRGLSLVAPISLLNFLNIASQQGILIKDGRSLELLGQIDTIVFDKTGTLTLQQPCVGRIYTCAAYTEQDVLTYAAAAEYKQAHPIALAIIEAAQAQQLPLLEVEETAYEVGYGLTVWVGEHCVRVGSTRFIEQLGLKLPEVLQQAVDAGYREGHSLVLVALDEELAGAIELHSTVRPEAKGVIEALRQQYGITSMYMLSGDHDVPTRKLADDLGMDHYVAQVSPEQKADLIERLQGEGKSVCFVGDGINDAIALKKAQASVSLRGASTIATDTAQVILMDGSLNQLVPLFDLAQAYDTNMRHNFMTVLVPLGIGLGGVFMWQFSLAHVIGCHFIGLFASLGNAMLPMVQYEPPETELPMPQLPASPGQIF
ncbi:heavy metal translocating P-type ATPase [Candidatus Entotheonella palauensis]|uniref:heavy metal translocating P-type ATPase n=1 Tax=Candidatus Entotheonella palauensis TaxID=93172 RepID=UPI0015C4938A|nr:heavy metal translocating P-type ATPase [Candidatus Entotheonella palauensis]